MDLQIRLMHFKLHQILQEPLGIFQEADSARFLRFFSEFQSSQFGLST